MFEELERLTGTLSDRYRIERELGRGGMATVHLATDLKHDRQVAVKVLRPALAYVIGSERFLREIRVTAALQHPHILQLYDSGECEGLLYYVTPYVPGESLRTRLDRERQLPVDESVTLISTVAGALDYAHRQGLVHRDIKPENILLLDGQPLLADFGIAVALASSSSDRLTETGFSVGTVQYMSPEQAAGDRAVQPQSDIYSLGAVAYEMLAGEPPFTGPTTEAIRARVMLQPPDAIRTIRPAVPEVVEAAVLKALSKVPADRFRTATEFAAALGAPGPVGSSSARSRRIHRYAAGAVAVTLLAAALIIFGRPRLEQTRASPAQRRQLTFSGNVLQAAISPDGRYVAHTVQAGGSHLLLVQDVEGGDPDTIGTFGWIHTLEWSPNGDRLLAGLEDGESAVLPRTGGSIRTLDVGRVPCQVRSHWLPDGLRVSLHCASDQRILVLDLETDDSVSIPLPAQFTWLKKGAWSPDGRHFALVTESIDPVAWTLVTIAMDGRVESVLEDSIPLAMPNWAHVGRSVYYARGGAEIWRIPMEPRTGRRRGAPEQLHRQLEALSTGEWLGGPVWGAQFSVTRDGLRMAYASGRRYSNLWLVDATDSLKPPRIDSLTSGTALRWWPVVSPDGNWIAFAQATGNAVELFRMPIAGGPSIQVTFGARVWPGTQIAWSPEGDRIAFISVRAGRANAWIATVDGGRLQSFSQSRVGTARGHLAWAPGAYIAYQTPDLNNIVLLDPSSGARRFLVADTAPGFLFSPRFSPDGDRLAAAWNRGRGDAGVWIFDLADSSQSKIAQGGIHGIHPGGWTVDGRYIFAGSPSIYLIDTRNVGPRRRLLTTPFRDAQCTSAGPLRPNAFVCAAFEFASDVWIVENFDLRGP